MISGLKGYPKMRESGVPWLGAIPAGWEVRRNGRLFAERNETGFPDLPILEVSLKTGVRVRDFDASTRKQVMADPAMYKRAARGDIAYNMMRMWQGAVGVAPVDGLVSPAYVVARPFPGTLPEYFAYLFRTAAYMGEVNNFSRGIVADRNRLYWDEFKQIPTPYPPPNEQAAITRFLDHADRKIRRYIRAKQKLIGLLEEQKRAIVHRAVTRGLDPSVRVKPSGIEWLGDVPESWTLKRFKFLARVTSGQVDPREHEFRNKILIAPNHMQPGSGTITHLETASEQGADSGKYSVHKGQIIYSKIRPNLRKAAIAPVNCLCSADMYPISVVEQDVEPCFFLQLLLSEPFTRYVADCSLRVAMPKVNRESLGQAWLWYPSIPVQREILAFIESEAAPIRRTIESAAHEIALLHEYRSRITSDVVTGRLDVREAGASLTTEHEDSRPVENIDDNPDWVEDEGEANELDEIGA